MGFKEAIGRITPEKIKKPFPIKAKSLDNFTDLVEDKGGIVIRAESVVKKKEGSFSTTVGFIGIFEYSTRLISRGLGGRRIIFNEFHQKRFGSEYGTADAQERRLMEIKSFITAESRLIELKRRLPTIETYNNPNNHKLNYKKRQSMRITAILNNIEPFSKSQSAKKR